MSLALLAILAAALPAAAPTTLPSTPRLGTEAARCRPHETGPAILVTVEGLKDRAGTLRAEVYPSTDGDFLADDNVLVSQGKTFRRAVIAVPMSGPAQLCLRIPAAGAYSLSVVHSRSGGHGFSLLHDGIGFAGNPRLGHSKPSAQAARIVAHGGITPTTVVMNYRSGLFSFAPLRR
ncbi:DUF2141 domain-containing protein [Sphingomonas sp. OK281]|uniref:DUF2141 domain-containing protein n=1 Tax=Sphingomonas sp. OK281 TaxID=1881067 RepID=UPI0008E50234|nr:DUF2141 domain-containing protein [Sphingomonas sp. OK281]SFO17432.1 Uncharacterized conserved protein, DUF2141 family [Sphingomonas sp. OK281]